MGCHSSTLVGSGLDNHDVTRNAIMKAAASKSHAHPTVVQRSRIRYEPIEQFYHFESRVIGSGYNGPVRLAINRRLNKAFAVKSFKKKRISSKKMALLKSEVDIYLRLDHPNIARLHEVFEDDKFVHIVMEYCKGKELYHRLVSEEGQHFSESVAAETTYQMLLPLKYLHAHNVVHRDIKLENYLYDSKDENATLKLIDFGFSKIIDPSRRMHQSCGSVAYVAPEVLEGSYTNKCDLWSLGVIVYMLLSGSPPFHGPERDMLVSIEEGEYEMPEEKWANISPQAKDFVRRLLIRDPEERMSASEALQHPWIVGRSSKVCGSYQIGDEVLESMRRYAACSHFRRAAMCMMAYSLTSDEISDLKFQFWALDTERKGVIKLSDMVEVMKGKLDISNREIEHMFNVLDQSGDGEIEYSEFVAAMLLNRVKFHEDLVRDTFRAFDVKGTGKLNVNDVLAILGKDAEDAEELFREGEVDENGEIDYEKFLRALRLERDDTDSNHLRLKSIGMVVDSAVASRPQSEQTIGRKMSRIKSITDALPPTALFEQYEGTSDRLAIPDEISYKKPYGISDAARQESARCSEAPTVTGVSSDELYSSQISKEGAETRSPGKAAVVNGVVG
ncbi:calcium-dependent protein kinase, putative [Perkinsus marinus ATCC 50983]|uniref:non-specific serine/threonine protein kinase n=1 Tax=Perkinsus marinus (strain ATCC 50983 / TXsc) TaxID=423536 RepID=C5LAG7_PERM5|nr:calcium-dependent protein kinase, putative [Perkinsus marinus ATCC 50983]EER06423.1 calcium-dependent protein kinase, putative [Perkinsus marinus ATCC 50983]|eukprot:XP_002774607.1 calcium-dependent protein kinase, putative [Perkinsus marinus ATCC 50983]